MPLLPQDVTRLSDSSLVFPSTTPPCKEPLPALHGLASWGPSEKLSQPGSSSCSVRPFVCPQATLTAPEFMAYGLSIPW